MRRQLLAWLVGLAVALLWAGESRAQVGAAQATYGGVGPYYAAPGNYGMAWGSPGFGSVRTYSAFSSSYGPGYGYGYAPYGFLPGRYGVNLWRPGFTAPGYAYGAPYYRTFPIVPYQVVPPSPPVGLYAPGLGFPSNGGAYMR